MKKRIIIVSVISIILSSTLILNAEPLNNAYEILINYIGIQVNGVNVNVDSINYNGSTYIPVEKAADTLGKNVKLDEQLKTLSINDIRTEDKDIIGVWKSIDIVDNISKFSPDKMNWKSNLYIKQLDFKADGKISYINDMTSSYSIWGDGVVFMGLFKDGRIEDKRVAQHYLVKNINGKLYMFFEHKNGDYMRGTANPIIYVLKKETNNTAVQQEQPASIPTPSSAPTPTPTPSPTPTPTIPPKQTQVTDYIFAEYNTFKNIDDLMQVRIDKVEIIKYSSKNSIKVKYTLKNISGDPIGEKSLCLYLSDGSLVYAGGIYLGSIKPNETLTRQVEISYNAALKPDFLTIMEFEDLFGEGTSLESKVKWKVPFKTE